MSSFVGFFGNSDGLKSKIYGLVPESDFSFTSETLFILGKGNPLNTHFQINPDAESGWIACGIGISSGSNPRTFDQTDWKETFESTTDFHPDINGHFAVAKWDKSGVELYTDQIGMRNIFIAKIESRILFSTRLDWLISLAPNLSINWKKFGSNWLSINSFSSDCFLNGVDRLAQGGYAKISENGLELSNKRWTPSKVSSNTDSIEESLKSLSEAALDKFSRISLGLSGGLDSRVLLALLLSTKDSNFDVYTFTKAHHPDEIVAKKLSGAYQIDHKFIPLEELPVDEIVSTLSEVSQRSMLNTSIFALEVLKGYEQLGKQNSITLDGGFGEIGRRRYLLGVEMRASKLISIKSSAALLPFFRSTKADIFSSEVVAEMNTGLELEFETEVSAMPDAHDIGIGNWLDLFAIRTRGQNLYGLKQEYSDELLFHYMPFLQPDFLNQLLSLPEKKRKNAFLFRKMIEKNAKKLQRFELIKGYENYPYWMKNLSSMVWMKGKRTLGFGYKSDANVHLMLRLEHFVKDTFSSNSAKEASCYDLQKINSLINDFYNSKKYSLATEIAWLLSFEIFRKELK